MLQNISCEKCGKEIPQERLEILPDTKTCKDCSTFSCHSRMFYSHKTAGEVQTIASDNVANYSDAKRQMDRAYKRAR